jgi:hypothetical protein
VFFEPLDLSLEVCPLFRRNRGSMPFEIWPERRHYTKGLGPPFLADAAIEFGPRGSHQQQSALDVPPDKIAPNSVRFSHCAVTSRLYANVSFVVNS